MKNIVTEKEFNDHIKNIPNVLTESEDYIQLIKNEEVELQEESLSKIHPAIFDAFNLSVAVITLLVKCKSKIQGFSNKRTSEKIILIAGFLQGVHVSKELILSGQYIKASAALKQDFEFMTRLKSINAGTHKYGVQPNTVNAPAGLRFIYGHANDIAHISKDDVLKFYVGLETDKGLGVTPIPQMKADQSSSFMLYLTAITFEILSEAMETHKELYGVDLCYKSSRIYYKYLIEIFKKIESQSTA